MQLREIILTKEDCESILKDLDDLVGLTLSMELVNLKKRAPTEKQGKSLINRDRKRYYRFGVDI